MSAKRVPVRVLPMDLFDGKYTRYLGFQHVPVIHEDNVAAAVQEIMVFLNQNRVNKEHNDGAEFLRAFASEILFVCTRKQVEVMELVRDFDALKPSDLMQAVRSELRGWHQRRYHSVLANWKSLKQLGLGLMDAWYLGTCLLEALRHAAGTADSREDSRQFLVWWELVSCRVDLIGMEMSIIDGTRDTVARMVSNEQASVIRYW